MSLGFTREEIAKYYYGTPQNVSQNTQSIPKLNPQPSTQLPPINNPNIPDDETRMKARNYIQTVYESQDDVSTPELKPINNPNIPDNDTRMQARNFIQAAYNGDIDENGALVSQNKPSNNSSRKKATKNKSTSAPFSTKENVKTSTPLDSKKYGKGNIDLTNRPRYVNEDGSISTVRSMSFNEDGKEILVPTVAYDSNGQAILLSDEEAIDRYHKTGEYLGKFNTIEEANRYANELHRSQEKMLDVPKDNPANKIGNYYAQKEKYLAKNATTSKYAEQKKIYEENKKKKEQAKLSAEEVKVENAPAYGSNMFLDVNNLNKTEQTSPLPTPTPNANELFNTDLEGIKEKANSVQTQDYFTTRTDTTRQKMIDKVGEDTINNLVNDLSGVLNNGGNSRENILDNLLDNNTKEIKDSLTKDEYKSFRKEVKARYREQFNQKVEDKARSFATENPALGTLASFGRTALMPVESLGNISTGFLTDDKRDLDYQQLRARQASREGAKSNINSTIGQTVYDLGTGLGDFGVSVGTGAITGLPTMLPSALNTAEEAQNRALENGSSVRKASAFGTGAGIADYVLNTKGLNFISDKLTTETVKTVGQALKNIGVGALTEGGENLAQEVVENVLDNIINGENSEIRNTFGNYIADGKSAEDAFKQTAIDTAKNLGMAFGTGALMGGAFAEGKMAINDIKNPRNVIPRVAENTPMEVPADRIVENAPQNNADRANLAQNNVVNEIPTIKENAVNEPINNSANITETITPTDVNDSTDVEPLRVATEAVNHRQLNANMNSLLNMFGRRSEENIGQLRALLNEYAQTGDENTIKEARSLAKEIDKEYDGAKYTSKKGTVTEYGYGNFGKFSDQVDMFQNALKNQSALSKTSLTPGMEDLNGRINDLFSRYDLSDDVSKDIRKWKQSIKNLANETNGDNFDNYFDATSKLFDDIRESKEFVSSYRGKVKANDFDVPEYMAINDAIEDMYRNKSFPKSMAEDIGLKNDNTLTVDMSDIPPMDETDITSGNESPGVERGLSKHMRDQGKMQMEGVADEVKADFVDNPDMYRQLSNKTTSDRATEAYNSGNGEEQFYDMLNRFDPAALPLGHQIAKDYSKAGNHSKAAEIYRIMGERLTKSGQFSQAAVLTMMKNDPMTALRYAQKEIDSLNAKGREEFGKKWKDFELTDDEIKAFESIKPGDENAIKDMFDKLGVRIGKDYPVKTWDKLLEGRRVAMLFNARTNIRNIGANIPTLGMRWMSDRVEALGQNLAHLIKPDFEVTQSARGSGIQGRKIANEAWNTDRVKALVEGTDGKYKPEIKSALLKNKQVFKGTAVEKWLNRVTDGGIEEVNKVLFGKEGVESIPETIRNATYKMLELGDSPFVKENFVERLGSYIRAQGIKNVDDIPDAAIETAWEEAMKATYKDDSWAVQMLRGVKTGMEKIPGIGKPLSQTAIPFLQAPGNIAARMVDYSPIKATKGVMDIISGAVKGSDDAVRKGIEEAAKGLTGSGMIILGMKLHNSGLLTGDYSEDKDQKNFQKEHGFKPFALRIKDRYYTYDWAQPFAEPMIIGTLLDEAIHNSDQYDSDILNFLGVENSKLGKVLGAIEEGGKASVNSWFNASPLQGLASLMRSDFTGNQDIAGNTISSLVENFGGAFVPSVVNATAKTIDTTQRNTYDPSNKVNNFINQQVAKIPFLSMTLPAKYDVWGEKVKNADNQYEAFAQRFLVPGEYSKDKNDSVDNEINRLFNETEEEKVFPMVAPNSVDGNKLDNKQVSKYQKDVGTRNRSLVEGFIDSEAYQRLADDEKVEIIGQLYGASKLITERDIFGKPVAEKSTYKSLIEAYDNAGGGQKGVDAMLGVIKAQNNEYGLSADTYNEMVANGASEEEMREAGERATTLKDLGMTNESKSFKAAYENDQMDLYEDYRKYLKDNDMRDSEEHWGDYQRQRGVQPTSTGAESFGQEKKESWNRVKRSLPNTTEEEFSKTFDDIDRDGHGDITQDEFIRYLTRKKYTNEAEAQRLAKAYGGWKKIPVLENKKWKFKKKK